MHLACDHRPSARFSEGWQGVAGLTDDLEELSIQEAKRVRRGMYLR